MVAAIIILTCMVPVLLVWWAFREIDRCFDQRMHMRQAERLAALAATRDPDSDAYKELIALAKQHARKAGFRR